MRGGLSRLELVLKCRRKKINAEGRGRSRRSNGELGGNRQEEGLLKLRINPRAQSGVTVPPNGDGMDGEFRRFGNVSGEREFIVAVRLCRRLWRICWLGWVEW